MKTTANLLVATDSFNWQDLNVDRSSDMDDLALALGLIAEAVDSIFGHPECYVLKKPWGDFYLLFQADCQFKPGWLTHDHQKTLIRLWNSNCTSGEACNLQELNDEFAGLNNGTLGCSLQPAVSGHVCSEPTWRDLHKNYTSTNPGLRETNEKYYYEFNAPHLLVAPGYIQTAIKNGHTDPFIVRLDVPATTTTGSVHGQQIHIHFSDGGALNIDGTWKHGQSKLSEIVKLQLVEWGFRLSQG